MRPIDGAELFRQVCRTHDEFVGLDELAELMDKMPAIDAIPVEWIEKHYLKADPSLYTVEDWAIENMLIDWRKENEQKSR